MANVSVFSHRLLDGLGCAVFILQDDGIRFANSTACALTGYDRTILTTIPFQDLVDPEFRSMLQSLMSALAESSKIEVRLETNVPQDVWAELTITHTEFEGQAALLVTATDITEKKRLEDSLRENEIRCKAIFNAIPDFIFQVNRAGVYLDYKAAVPNNSYVRTPDIIGMRLTDTMPQEFAEMALDCIRLALDTDTPQNWEYRITTPAGIEFFEARFTASTPDEAIVVVRNISKRKQMENALRRSNTQLQAILDNTTAVIFLRDLQGKYLLVNQQYEKIHRHTNDEVIGKTPYDLFPKEFADRFLENDRKVIASGVVTEFEELVPSSQGMRTHRSIKFLLFETDGTPYAVCGMTTDITDFKEAQVALVESEQRYRDLFEGIDDAIALHDIDAKILDVNEAACRRLGYTREELLKMKVTDIDAPEFAAGFANRLLKQMSQGHLGDISGVHIAKDGRRIFVDVNSKRITYRGKPAVLSVIRDITKRRHIEEQLRESQRFIRQVADTLPDNLYVYDLVERRNIYSNRAIETMLGYTVEEIQGMRGSSALLLSHPDDKSTLIEHGRRLANAQDGEIFSVEYRLKHTDGDWRWLHSRELVYTRDENGIPRQILGIAEDFSERKFAGERQAKLMADLEKANQDLKDFAYIVSHDLKAPLRGISSLASWLRSDHSHQLDEEGRHMLDLMSNRVMRMNALIDGVLQYSRIGRISEEKVEVDVNALIQDVIELLDPPAHITITIENLLPAITCEVTRMQQVFQNLIGNAIKFMDKPQGEIRISCVSDNGKWRFCIADNGPGIDEQYFTKVFQIFQTLAPRDELESTGIGLTIVKRIVEMYGGKIWLESKLGHGTSFYFTLPR